MTISAACASDVSGLRSGFTGKERDAESGNDYFGARYFGSSMGRFLSPDPFIPFNLKKDQFQAWISNPQHWNKYAYALNNPLKYTDPTGMTETVFLEFGKDLTAEQRKFINDHMDAIQSAIRAKLGEAGIKDVVLKDSSTLDHQQFLDVKAGVTGASYLVFANKAFGGYAAGKEYGITFDDHRSIIFMGNLLAKNGLESAQASTSIFRMKEVGSHELGHKMGFYSCQFCQLFFWRNDLKDEGQGMPHRSGQWDMTIPQNKNAVDEINKAPVYPPQ